MNTYGIATEQEWAEHNDLIHVGGKTYMAEDGELTYFDKSVNLDKSTWT